MTRGAMVAPFALALGLVLWPAVARPVLAQDDADELDGWESDDAELDDAELDDAEPDDAGPDAADADGSEGKSVQSGQWQLRASAGVGVTSRSVDLPMDGATLTTRTGMLPAFDVGFALDHGLSSALSLGLVVRYQSSLPGTGVVEQHVDGSTRPMDLRSHQLEVGLAPRLTLDDAGQWQLGASLGYASRNLRPEVHHLITPSYSLAGPHARAYLRIGLLGGALGLRLGPELHVLTSVGSELTGRGVEDGGMAFGGELELELAVSERFDVIASYRQVHAELAADGGDGYYDVARFVTLALEATW